MGTKIKPIKCPNCGSEKHTHKEDKCYLCQSCGTEYYIDDDDININVNHRFDYIPSSNDTLDIIRKLVIYGLVALAIGSFVILLPIFLSTSPRTSPILSQKDSIDVNNHTYVAITMNHNGKACLFYIAEKDFSTGTEKDPKHIDGVYYGFRDIKTGKILAEQLLGTGEAVLDFRISSYGNYFDLRYFNQANHWFLIISDRYIYEISPEQLTMKDVTKSLFEKKNAMSTGLSCAKLLYYEYGEGIKVVNNLAEMYYYFPGTDRLYTEEAFNYAKDLPPSQLNGELRDSIYYCLQKKNANSSTNNGGKYRFIKIHFKYHLGDPQNRYSFDDIGEKIWIYDDRLVSDSPITDWFTAFDAKIIYQDANYILMSYTTNISKTALPVFQLRSTNGRILWTQAPEKAIKDVNFCTLSNGQIWFQGDIDRPSEPTLKNVYSFSIANGQLTYYFTMPDSYKVPAN